MTQIVEIMEQIEKCLSSLNEDLEISFEEIESNEFEKQILNLLRIQQLSQPFNQLISNLETLMEPISQISSKFEASIMDKCVQKQSALKNSITQVPEPTAGQEQQKQQDTRNQKANKQDKKKVTTKSTTLNYLNLVQNTHMLRKVDAFEIHQYPLYFKKYIQNFEDYKTIILIGTKCSEKQKLINLFLNFQIGVEFSDPYRFETIDDIDITNQKQNEEYSSTKVYYITPLNGNPGLRIIYTQDYSDDLSYDDLGKHSSIISIISQSASLNQNILIGLVIPQQVQLGTFFMLESVLSHFSNSLISNVVFLFPDCTDDCPKQKETLQSNTKLINGIASPVFNMIPKFNNSWYLKFNTSILFTENLTQENQFLWDMGQNAFQLLLQNYLQNGIQYSDEMNKKQNEFLNGGIMQGFTFDNFRKQVQQFYEKSNLVKEQKKIENDLSNIIWKNYKSERHEDYRRIYCNCGKNCEFCNSTNSIVSKLFSLSLYIERFKKNLCWYDRTDPDALSSQLNNFKKEIPNYLLSKFKSWSEYLKFNSILSFINLGQEKYYENLISKEKCSQQSGWEGRVNHLMERYNFWICSSNYFQGSKCQKMEQLLNNWPVYKFSFEEVTIRDGGLEYKSEYEEYHYNGKQLRNVLICYDQGKNAKSEQIYINKDEQLITNFQRHLSNLKLCEH
ncbi:unnamed protein product [Paramecium octaurelia]|uniref:Uncharacterized protein n=1 Tax=Paramecium octaurelia TaxID=43137 RepID=A0A8S1YKY5_PAROT|nr:unnamed protein product [Paramecium octaurelia]